MQSQTSPNPGFPVPGAEAQLHTVSSLLQTMDDATAVGAEILGQADSLVAARLGVASSLFLALRAKHPPTAAHSLRVAIGASSWSAAMNLDDEQRNNIEVAALLHDIGKIGVPDHVLVKPGKLSSDEVLEMERHRDVGHEIISACCTSNDVLDIVTHSSAWYDGSVDGFDLTGEDLPLGARMIAILDAFDAMTTDHPYRRSLPRERAIAELFEYSGTQFSPALVQDFSTNDLAQLHSGVSQRWLREVSSDHTSGMWGLQTPWMDESADSPGSIFHRTLLDSTRDGIVFIDSQLRIACWNRAAERLTGLSAEGLVGTRWSPDLVGLSDEQGSELAADADPVAEVLSSSTQTLRRFMLRGGKDDQVSIDAHITPAFGNDGLLHGATLVLHDASSQITLEERVQHLHEKATRDPLTKVANRAEFDRLLPELVTAHLEHNESCSMIICDIDRFKQINDNYGHPAGDEALVSFAALLQRHARAGDLVARYGGEEFVILCADCDNTAATRRAEEIRHRLAALPQTSLAGRAITASFGVTEVQGGDTPDTFLRRADRALLQAKDNGRNLVVQLGTGIGEDDEPTTQPRGWFNWFNKKTEKDLLRQQLATVVPLTVAADKLRGFIADHHAELLEVQGNRVALQIDGPNAPLTRRWNDRPVPFLLDLTFEEVQEQPKSSHRTVIQVAIRPKRQRDRRQHDVTERARQLLVSVKSYLMAHDFISPECDHRDDEAKESFLAQASEVLAELLS